MYYRKGRFSLYLGHWLIWARIRDREGMTGPFFVRIGSEAPNG